MKREMMDILACPVCKRKLELTVDEENEREIVTGSFYCGKCDVRYLIEDTIPNLLPPEQRRQSGE
ncbi:MAG: methytransferase partner Trm112 [Chloroflexi bacterium]|nr:methytransferase partner Trm112 [Chloroflexota bacterium]